MRTNRNGRRIVLATPFAVALSTVAAFAQGPGGPPQTLSPQAPATAAPAAPGASPAPAGEETSSDAERLIDEAIKKVAAVKTVSASLTQDVKMLGQKFQVKGRYLRATGSRAYLDLDVLGLPGSPGRMLQVSDGAVLWDYRKVLDAQSYRKVDVKPILERLDAPEIDRAGRAQILSSLGLAGPEALLAGLRKSVRFDQMDEANRDGHVVWVVQGRWRDRAAPPPDARPGSKVPKVPPYIPSLATLTLDKATGWPYRVELRGSPEIGLFDTRAVGLDGQRIGSLSSIEKTQPSEFILVYTNVDFAPTLSDADFPIPKPPQGAEIKDETNDILARVDALIAGEVLRRRIEEAKANDSVLPRPIDIPTPPPAAEVPH